MIMGPAGGGQHHPPAALAEEAVPQAKVGLPLDAVGERAAETGIQDQDLAAGPAVLQLVQHPGRLDPGRPEPVLRVSAAAKYSRRRVSSSPWQDG
jgi:hypothetical protein